MSELSHQSPLAGAAAPAGLSISLREITDRGMIDLRGLASDEAFMSAAHDALGFALPTAPRSSAAWGDVRVLWLSVDQWLVLSTRNKAHEILANLRMSLKGIHSLAVDVSDMRAVIRLEGEGCREVLMKGTSLDLLAPEYKPGCCRRMRFAEIAALLHVVEDKVFDIYVFRSYAHYAWNFLCATAREPAKIKLFGAQDVGGGTAGPLLSAEFEGGIRDRLPDVMGEAAHGVDVEVILSRAMYRDRRVVDA